jgi:hypothetical protein
MNTAQLIYSAAMNAPEAPEPTQAQMDMAATDRAAEILDAVAASNLTAAQALAGDAYRINQPVDMLLADWLSGCDKDGTQPGSHLRRALVLAAQGQAVAAGWMLVQAVQAAALAQAHDEQEQRPRFRNVYCSHCGGTFGPGNGGFSSCRGHNGIRRLA